MPDDPLAEERPGTEAGAPIAPPPVDLATAADPAPAPVVRARPRLAVSTAIFAFLTGLSRIAGLIREVVASSYFGTRGAFSAFTIAFQVPNLLRALVADAALGAAFVPVFTGLLEQKRRKEAFELASSLFLIILIALSAITLLFIALAGWVMPLFTGDKFSSELTDLTVGLSRVLFPIVVLLGLNGLTLGILNAHDHFTIPAIAPLAWNVVIIVVLVILRRFFHGDEQLYAYAIGVLAGTIVQFGMSLPMLARLGFRPRLKIDRHDPRIRQIFRLMLPVTLGLGVINLDLIINSGLGTLVSESAPRAIDAAFRIYMLPQGIFSVALATVLFPALSRYAARRDMGGLRVTLANGVRQIYLLLIPAAAFTIVLAEPIVRLVFERGNFGPSSTHEVSIALFWFSFSLPFAGVNLLLTRTFFSLQQPWTPTALAAGNMAVNAGLSLALYKPLGIAGLVIATAVASIGMMLGQAYLLARPLGGVEGARTLLVTAQLTFAAAGLGAIAWLTWWSLDQVVGRSLLGQLLSVGTAITAGTLVYAGLVLLMRIPEARQISSLVAGRRRRGGAA